jgi:hypothetical protein
MSPLRGSPSSLCWRARTEPTVRSQAILVALGGEDEEAVTGPHWLLGGKLDGLTVPASFIRTKDMEARKDHAPAHLLSKSRLFCFERSGRT